MISVHRLLPAFEENDTGAGGRREARASKSLNECSFQNDPTLPSPVFAHGSLTQDLIQETISDGINSFVSTFSTATKPSKSMPLRYSKLSCLISRTSTTMDYAILLSICHYEAPTRKFFFPSLLFYSSGES